MVYLKNISALQGLGDMKWWYKAFTYTSLNLPSCPLHVLFFRLHTRKLWFAQICSAMCCNNLISGDDQMTWRPFSLKKCNLSVCRPSCSSLDKKQDIFGKEMSVTLMRWLCFFVGLVSSRAVTCIISYNGSWQNNPGKMVLRCPTQQTRRRRRRRRRRKRRRRRRRRSVYSTMKISKWKMSEIFFTGWFGRPPLRPQGR